MKIASGPEGVGSAKAEPGRRLGGLAAADLRSLRGLQASGGLQPSGVAVAWHTPRHLRSRRTRRTSGGFDANPRRRNPRRLQPPGWTHPGHHRRAYFGSNQSARRPPAPQRSPFHRRQPAQTPTALRLRRPGAHIPRSDRHSAAAKDPVAVKAAKSHRRQTTPRPSTPAKSPPPPTTPTPSMPAKPPPPTQPRSPSRPPAIGPR